MITASLELGADFQVTVRTTNGRGFTPQELAKQCAEKIVSVSDGAHPAIREQALAYRGRIEQLVETYLKQAVQSDRTTVCKALMDADQPQLAQLIRGL